MIREFLNMIRAKNLFLLFIKMSIESFNSENRFLARIMFNNSRIMLVFVLKIKVYTNAQF